jgi:hypothetical protein
MITSIPKIAEVDYCGVYQASDKASKDAQHSYITIIAIDLSAMILAAAISIYNYSSTNSKQSIYVISGLLLLLGLILSIVILTMKFEDTWYQGRALAESCKTLTWRFMTCSELFENTLTTMEAENRFVTRITALSAKFSHLNKAMDPILLNLSYISPLMKQVRNLPLNDRKQYYIDHRLEDQKQWYATKATFNKEKYRNWFMVIIASQTLSLVAIVTLIKYPDSNWNLVGLFTTLASSAISWLQLKQHQELKQAYTTATQELNSILALSSSVITEVQFSEFVLDSENAISREHTMWLAQKRST